MRAVDTNILVRLIMRDDPQQFGSAAAFVERGAWVSLLVLADLAWVLSKEHDLSDADIATAIEMLLKHEQLTVQDADVVAAALDNYRRKPALGFLDCLILEIARKAGHLPLGTFDKALSKLDGAVRL